jgi:hypothetical protein
VPTGDDAMTDTAPNLQVTLLETSFEHIKPQADAFVGSFYGNLFTQSLFRPLR